ncbi:peroxisomal N(1)-acetyl-spermine/spermidine oxidase-like [Lycorma delicatula]|uniref:peroxisomal N(1)-acetyl-spermine/spermidine oxidase-like n=1 Tax=Lycorma delicatula TaxID=130591 RepID=UPI003F50DDBA
MSNYYNESGLRKSAQVTGMSIQQTSIINKELQSLLSNEEYISGREECQNHLQKKLGFLKTYPKYILSAKERIRFKIHSKNLNSAICSLSETPKVIIVGAGIAGLSAAERLIQSGFDNVTILEATERPGGRIHSCSLGQSVAELGAQWLSGSTAANSIVTLASQEGLMHPKCIHSYDFKSGNYITSEGRQLNKNLSTQAYLTFRLIEEQAYALYKFKTGGGSLKDFFSVRINQELSNFPKHQREDASRIMFGLTNKISNRWGADIDDLRTETFGSFKKISDETIAFSSGFSGVLAPLIQNIPDNTIHYEKDVKKIQWGDDVCETRAIVSTSDFTKYFADFVVITISLGVLKKQARMLFSPQLPEEKTKAIQKLGFGNIVKIFVEYKNPFWIPKKGRIKFAWSKEELKQKNSWMRGLNSLEELPGSNNIMMGIVAGSYANEVEEISDLQVVECLTYMLRQISKDTTLPYPTSILKSKWGSCPYFMGTNSYFRKGSNIEHMEDLRTPVPNGTIRKGKKNVSIPVIFFAGEATTPQFFSTVHGARLSGLKAAKDIIDLTVKYGGPPPKLKVTHEKKENIDEENECCN